MTRMTKKFTAGSCLSRLSVGKKSRKMFSKKTRDKKEKMCMRFYF